MNTKRISIWALFIIAFAALIFLLYKYGGGSESPRTPSSVSEIRAEDKVLGKSDAKVTVAEYADFQCPACALYSPLLNQLMKDEPDKFKLVYRYFPLVSIHRNGMISSQAGEAASLQGKFWEMHDLLYEKQNEWSESGNAESIFVDMAGQLGLDKNKFQNDLNSDQVRLAVQNGLREAQDLGLNSTPTFFVNGKKLDQNPRTLEEFKNIINQAAQQ